MDSSSDNNFEAPGDAHQDSPPPKPKEETGGAEEEAEDGEKTLERAEELLDRGSKAVEDLLLPQRRPRDQKKQKKTSNASPGASTPGTTSSWYVDEAEASTQKDDPLRRPIGKKTMKEQLRRGNSSASSQDSSVLPAMNDVWSNKKEAGAVKEANKVEHNEQAFALEEKRMAFEEKKIELKRKERDLRIWMMAVEKQTLEFQGTERDERIMSMDTSAMTGLKQQYFMSLQNEILAR